MEESLPDARVSAEALAMGPVVSGFDLLLGHLDCATCVWLKQVVHEAHRKWCQIVSIFDARQPLVVLNIVHNCLLGSQVGFTFLAQNRQAGLDGRFHQCCLVWISLL